LNTVGSISFSRRPSLPGVMHNPGYKRTYFLLSILYMRKWLNLSGDTSLSLPATFRLVLGLIETPIYWLPWCFPWDKAEWMQSSPLTIISA
jgi:hypothetical protein